MDFLINVISPLIVMFCLMASIGLLYIGLMVYIEAQRIDKEIRKKEEYLDKEIDSLGLFYTNNIDRDTILAIQLSNCFNSTKSILVYEMWRHLYISNGCISLDLSDIDFNRFELNTNLPRTEVEKLIKRYFLMGLSNENIFAYSILN